MRISPARRLFALLWALVFVLGTASEALGVHSCPQHGEERAEAHPAQADPHAGHGASTEGHGAPGDSHGPCTCEAHCQTGAGVAMPAPDRGQISVGESPQSVAPVAYVWAPAALRPSHFLPFAQAPPLIG